MTRSVVVVSPDLGFCNDVADVLAPRGVAVSSVADPTALRSLSPLRWHDLLLLIIDVDAPGAWDFVALEDRLGGLLFGTSFLVASHQPVRHAWDDDDDDRAAARPWTGALAKPPQPALLLQVLDRELLFARHAERATSPRSS
jgi:hypothetical protein